MIEKSVDMNVQRKRSGGGHYGARFCVIDTDLTVHVSSLRMAGLEHWRLEKGNKKSQSVYHLCLLDC